MGLKLSLLKCPDCGKSLTAENNDRVIYCSVCSKGFEYYNNNFTPLKITETVYDISAERKPFWNYKIKASYSYQIVFHFTHNFKYSSSTSLIFPSQSYCFTIIS